MKPRHNHFPSVTSVHTTGRCQRVSLKTPCDHFRTSSELTTVHVPWFSWTTQSLFSVVFFPVSYAITKKNSHEIIDSVWGFQTASLTRWSHLCPLVSCSQRLMKKPNKLYNYFIDSAARSWFLTRQRIQTSWTKI